MRRRRRVRSSSSNRDHPWISVDISSSSTGGEGRWVGQKSKKKARFPPIKKRQAISRAPEPPTVPQQAQPEGNISNTIFAHRAP
eukprot:9350065-Karenia_brevis.AAC.1